MERADCGLCFCFSLQCFDVLMNRPRMANSRSNMNIPAFPITMKTLAKICQKEPKTGKLSKSGREKPKLQICFTTEIAINCGHTMFSLQIISIVNWSLFVQVHISFVT